MPKVLVVDDEPDLVDSLKAQLEGLGHTVLTALDGHSALEAARRESPELILLDLMLPGLDGYRVLRLLKKDRRFREIPILVITARCDAEDVTQALECGADGCIVKPLKLEVLLKHIESVLSRNRRNRR